MPSDEEVICNWMDWARTTFLATPASGHLGLLWEVEERLADEQWTRYGALLTTGPKTFAPPPAIRGKKCTQAVDYGRKKLIHATPEQKIKALAAVIRCHVCLAQ